MRHIIFRVVRRCIMSEKNKKQKKGFNSDEKTTFGVGVFLGLLGLLSICIALVRINEIKNVETFEEVEMTVTSVSKEQKELSKSERNRISSAEERVGRSLNKGEYKYYIDSETYYRAKVETVIDGKKVKGKYYQSGYMKKGDKVKTIVMRTNKGKCKVFDPVKYGFGNYIGTGALAVIIGLGLMGMACISRAMGEPEKKNKKLV